MKIAIISFTDNGADALKRIISAIDAVFFVHDKAVQTAKQWIGNSFYSCDAVVFIGSCGIATRLIAPLLVAKDKDPAVIVVDEKGQFVIPILSGHIGGANALAVQIAKAFGATPVITTATDINGVFAVDSWAVGCGCSVFNIAQIKNISSALLKGQSVGFSTAFDISGTLPKGLYTAQSGDLGVSVSVGTQANPFVNTLHIVPKIIALGVGCRKNTDTQAFEDFINSTLKQNNIAISAVKTITSIDLKSKEQCILAFCEKYDIVFVTFSPDQLNSVEGVFTASDFVRQTTGVDNVCERSAIKAVEQCGGKLMVKKTSYNGITVAVAMEKWECVF